MKKDGLKDRLSRIRHTDRHRQELGKRDHEPRLVCADDEKLYLLYLLGGGRVSLVTPRPKH
jgi:hypothetical protein